MHSHFSVVSLQLRQLLKTQRYAYLVASRRTYQSVYLVEIQCRQLIHDDADRNILPLPGVHTGNETVQYQSVQRSDDAFHLRVVGNQQVARILRVAHFQVEVVPVLVEYPIGFFGSQTAGIDTQRTNHTFQLFHRLVFEGRLERTEQWRNLVVRLQHLKNSLVALIEK